MNSSKSFTSYLFSLFLKYVIFFSPPLNMQMMKLNSSEETSIRISCVTIPHHFNFPSMVLDKCVLKSTFFDTFITSTQFSHDCVIVIPLYLQFFHKNVKPRWLISLFSKQNILIQSFQCSACVSRRTG